MHSSELKYQNQLCRIIHPHLLERRFSSILKGSVVVGGRTIGGIGGIGSGCLGVRRLNIGWLIIWLLRGSVVDILDVSSLLGLFDITILRLSLLLNLNILNLRLLDWLFIDVLNLWLLDWLLNIFNDSGLGLRLDIFDILNLRLLDWLFIDIGDFLRLGVLNWDSFNVLDWFVFYNCAFIGNKFNAAFSSSLVGRGVDDYNFLHLLTQWLNILGLSCGLGINILRCGLRGIVCLLGLGSFTNYILRLGLRLIV
jgi:hypothetical protein